MSDPFGPPGGLPPSDPVPSSGRPEFLQAKYVIGLSVAAVVMLIAGIAVVTMGGGDSVTTKQVATTSTSTTTRVLVTTPVPLPATTTTTTSTSTSSTTSTSTTTTTTLAPVPAVANAGDDQAVDFGDVVNLVALELSEQNQSVVWRQTAGPDVTGGSGRMIGAEANFEAPAELATLRFDMVVTGRGGDVARDELRIDVYEQADRALFVDGVDGSGDGDGSRARPYRELVTALTQAEVRADGTDVYIRTVESAYAVDAVIQHGSSLYGGYDADWVRSNDGRAVIGGRLSFAGPNPLVVSSIDLRGFNDTDGPVLSVSGAASFRLEGSIVRAGASSNSVNVAVLIDDVTSAEVVRSEIYGGQAGPGPSAARPVEPDPPLIAGVDGGDAIDRLGAPAVGEQLVTQGGDGSALDVPGDAGGGGAAGGDPGQAGAPGAGGAGGAPGISGAGGLGSAVDGLTGAQGGPGALGGDGQPGGGGGGGGGMIAHDGGGGGAGGTGGQGGTPGLGGEGGRAAISLAVSNVDRLELRDSIIQGGLAGDGGNGGAPVNGLRGGSGGLGAPGVSSFLDTAGPGGNGAGGGAGGQGGWGGGGAGGPSIGLSTIGVGTAVVVDSTITGGQGGAGGSGGLASSGGRSGGDAGVVDDPGAGGSGVGESLGEIAPQSSGGDSIGWSDHDDTQREISGSSIEAGSPGSPGGEGGPAGLAIDTTF